LGLKAFPTLDDLLSQVELLVCHSDTSHYRCGDASDQAWCTSPHRETNTTTIDQAKALTERAEIKGLKLQVGHIERFNPAILALEPYNITPLFIESHRLAQFNPRGSDVAVVLDLMIHDIDLILSLVKSKVTRIDANGIAVISDTPDIAKRASAVREWLCCKCDSEPHLAK